jgi:hypothetical protein
MVPTVTPGPKVACVPSLNTTVLVPVPDIVKVRAVAVLGHIDWLPLNVAVGTAFTVMVATPAVKLAAEERIHPLASEMLTNE